MIDPHPREGATSPELQNSRSDLTITIFPVCDQIKIILGVLVHSLIEASDEKRLLRLHGQLVGYKLLIVDELGYVPLSTSDTELLF